MQIAAQGIEPRWKMRRELKSPNYTTKLVDMPVVRCENYDIKKGMKRRFDELLEKCKENSKALQNIDGAKKAFLHLLEIYKQTSATQDVEKSNRLSEIASDTFYAGVIKYCKPFTETKKRGKTIKYPIKPIKKNDVSRNSVLDGYAQSSFRCTE